MYEAIRRGESLELMLYDDIGEGFFGGISAASVVSDLNANDDATQIDVRINSPGGDVFEGVAIYNALERHTGSVTVHVDALAASIASVIAMAGDRIEIAPTAMMMIHNPWTIAGGDAGEFRRVAGLLDQIGSSIVRAYVDGTDGEEQPIIDAMNAETWFTADESIEFGLAHALSESPMQVAAAAFSPDRFRNTPAVLKAQKMEEQPLAAWKQEARDRRLKMMRKA